MKVQRWIVPLLAVALLFGSIIVAKAFGWWQTSGTRITTLENASPDDIRGSSTLGEVAQSFGIPLVELRQVLGVPADTPPETPMKELEEYVEVSVARELVAAHLGLSSLTEDQGATPGISLVTEATPTAAEVSPTTAVTAAHAGPTPLPAGQALPATEIKGRMALREVSEQTGMPLDLLYERLKLDGKISPDLPMRDISSQAPDFEVSAVRDVVTAYQAGQ